MTSQGPRPIHFGACEHFRSGSIRQIFGEVQSTVSGLRSARSPSGSWPASRMNCAHASPATTRASLQSHLRSAKSIAPNVRNGGFQSAERTPISCRIVQSNIQTRPVTGSKCPKLWICSNTTGRKPDILPGNSSFPINKLDWNAHYRIVRTDSNFKPEREGIDMAKAAAKKKMVKKTAKKPAAKKRTAKRR